MVSWAKRQSKAADLLRKWQVGTLGLGNYWKKTIAWQWKCRFISSWQKQRGEKPHSSFLRHLLGEKLTLNDSFVLGARISCGYDTVRCVWYILALVWSPLFWLGSFHPHISHMWLILTAGKVTHTSVSWVGLLCGVLPRTQNLGEISLWSYVFEANEKKKSSRENMWCMKTKKKPQNNGYVLVPIWNVLFFFVFWVISLCDSSWYDVTMPLFRFTSVPLLPKQRVIFVILLQIGSYSDSLSCVKTNMQ